MSVYGYTKNQILNLFSKQIKVFSLENKVIFDLPSLIKEESTLLVKQLKGKSKDQNHIAITYFNSFQYQIGLIV